MPEEMDLLGKHLQRPRYQEAADDRSKPIHSCRQVLEKFDEENVFQAFDLQIFEDHQLTQRSHKNFGVFVRD